MSFIKWLLENTNYEDSCIKFNLVSREVNQTKGNKFKIFQDHVHYNLRKYYFSNRVK